MRIIIGLLLGASLLLPADLPNGEEGGTLGAVLADDRNSIVARAEKIKEGTRTRSDRANGERDDDKSLKPKACPIGTFCPLDRGTFSVEINTPTITITDLVSFAPAPVSFAAEPQNLGITGLPTNFLATATTHTQTGTLFDRSITVRFTPAGYDYAYGDGDTASIIEPGRTWEDLDQAQFTPTPTSHTYADTGNFTATVATRYTAEVDLGDGWYPIPGEITIQSSPATIRIYRAYTALVSRTCIEDPSAPGC